MQIRNKPTKLPKVASTLVVLISLLVLAGWAFNIDFLKRVIPDAVAMNPITAVAFILSSVSLFFFQSDVLDAQRFAKIRRNTAFLCAAAAALVGLVRLLGYASGWDIGIDRLLFTSKLSTAGGGPNILNRIAPNTALNFFFAGSALIITGFRSRRFRWLSHLTHGMLLFVVFTSFLAFLGHTYDAPGFYRIFPFIGMAVNTAVCFIILGIGILAANPDQGIMAIVASPHLGGIVARRLLPIAFIVPVALGWLRLWGQRTGLYGTEFGLGLMVTFSVVLLTIVVLRIAASLNRTDSDRWLAEEEIRSLNAELEKRVIQRTAQLEAANKELEAFSYSVSHDLRAPLRAIDGFSKIVIEDYYNKLDEEGRRQLNVIRDNTQKMGKLIDDLLSLSRLGRKEMNFAEIRMDELAKNVFDELKAADSQRNLQFNIKALPNAYGDRALIHQIFANLISNAIKFTKPKDAAIIEIGGWGEEEEDIYYVKDNGVGFDMQYKDKLFGVFQRLHNESEFEGIGVGLAIAHRIIQRHGGRLWAEAEVNKGATFYFTLPKNRGGNRYDRFE